ncbi:Methyltransferase type 12 [Chthoniobacter flavus Ellin428]|uniref:Methyltransferase type 12 n=1 Tax=Chthoniobacter flavus Ellin428 TaxID=497964 RepID=B4CXM0_9BACT|nr:class I SAM-dependent methyltransferase [Chthoniobacter flavus]EDY21018.1 Methyltransferase type 12 [Chthoniobacter flavus Ellin428]TCO88743.1 methyltransferase family protein [Chthoniobacter flavus]
MSDLELEGSPAVALADYDSIARVYDLWASCDPASKPCWDFYRREVTRHGGVCLEVGVGTGAVMLGAGPTVAHYYGIDLSRSMLAELETKRASLPPLPFSYTLIHGDVRQIRLSGPPPTLAIVPFRTVGHFLTADSRIALLRHLREICAPGARCILDHYKFNLKWAQQHDRVTRWMGEGTINGQTFVLSDTYAYDFARREMECLLCVEEIARHGTVVNKRYSAFRFSWLEDDEVYRYAEIAGWRVEQRWGDFEYSDFSGDAKDQVWLLRAP